MKNIDRIRLACGFHTNPDEGMCIMEACAWLANEKFSDRPECVSPIIGAFMRHINDSMNDEQRQLLKPYITKIMYTNKPELYVKQAIMFTESATAYAGLAAEYAASSAEFATKHANRCVKYAAMSADCATQSDQYAKFAIQSGVKSIAKYAAQDAAVYAAASAEFAAMSVYYATRSFPYNKGGKYSSELLALIFKTLDEVLELT